ncbi:hypothetical protein GIB67_040431 [Kingdonia uniflora]|uniref:Protein kinase domain-containing protein n=1 Tax=Kingdonia uniflora TaxID=39325 RepID=A0A7J7KXL6_9MAGN|nr:hypothetical protein GIB67_040431 [Kingdonia uniflora]
MEHSKNYEQLQYNPMETRNEGLASASQTYLQDPSSYINTNMRPPEFSVLGGSKPVRNYSIQTGEEFALEFMRERVNPRMPFIAHAASDPNNATGYMDIKGTPGISHTGSEGGSDIPMVATLEKTRVKEFERKGSSGNENRGYYESMRSIPRSLSRNGSSQGIHGYASSGASDSLSAKIKFLCSFGGKILPRPSDGKLRYVGGETRIVRISKDVSWQGLVEKTMSLYNEAHTIKYQLPGEELDALVSVSCDEDLQNMLEECNVIEDGSRFQKPRMFLISISDFDDPHFGLGSMEGDSELQYVVAVNGMDLGPRKNSSEQLASTSANNLDQLLSLKEESDTRKVEEESMGSSAKALADTFVSNAPTTQPTLTSSSSVYETHVQPYSGQMHHHVEAEQYPFFPAHPDYNLGGGTAVPSSGPLQYVDHFCSSNYIPYEDAGPMLYQQGGTTEGQPYYGFMVHNSEVPGNATKLNVDGTVPQTKSEYLGSIPNFTGVEGVAPESRDPFSTSNNDMQQETLTRSLHPDAINSGKFHKPIDEEHFTSGGAFTLGYTGSEADSTDPSYAEPPVHPQRVFHSERIPHKQAEPELINRLSKSDDSFGSQFLITHSHSGLAQQVGVIESADKLHEGNLASQTETPIFSAKPLHTNPPTIEEGLVQFEKYKELAHAISNEPKSEFRKISDRDNIAPVVGKDAISRDGFPPVKEFSVTEAERAGFPPGEQGASVKHYDDSSSRLADLHWAEIDDKATSSNNIMTDANNVAGSGALTGNVPHEESSLAKQPTQEHGDILIDINDRFPRDFLSDIFSRARETENFSGISQLYNDGTGLSLNIENHEPKHWSFFQKLAQDEFIRKDVSLMDQDHPGFSSRLTKVEEDMPGTYHFPPLKTAVVSSGQLGSELGSMEEIQEESSIVYCDPSRVKDSVQFDGMENLRTPESDYEDGKLETGNVGGPLFDCSLGDLDISDLQIIMNEDLEELKELGSGTFGTVYHGKWRGTDVAIKRIKKSCFTGRSSEQERLTVEFWREADILSKLHHPNVVAFYGVVQDGPGATMATVTEFMVNGSLRHVLLRRDRYLDRRKRLIIAMDAAFGMEYLHSKNIVHFDLKCDNLLVNLKDPQRPICKVGDFGLSKIKRNTLVTGGVRGTLPWMAPELLNGSSSKVSEKVDVFSFGIVLWEILTGEEPYANMHYGAIIGGIVSNTLRPPVPSFCDAEWRTLMEHCWAPDHVARPSFTEIARRLRVMTAACPTKPQGYQVAK